MADLERGLISKVINTRDIVTAIEAKITEEFFASEEHRRVWSWCLEYFRRYGEAPSLRALKANFPTYKVFEVEEPYQFFLDELRGRRAFVIMQEHMGDAVEALSDDALTPQGAADAALHVITSMVTQVGTEVTKLKDANVIETHTARMSRYRTYSATPGGMRGLPYGFPSLDAATSGAQPEQLITLVGLPKAGKSAFLLSFALAAHMAGATPLFVGFEMSNEEQEARLDAMVAKVSHTKLLQGTLSEIDLARLEKVLQNRSHMHPFILSSDISSATTVSGLGAKVSQYRPAILYVDGTYLMDDEHGEPKGSSQALTNITRGLKRLAQTHRIPIVITTQALGWKTSRTKGIDADSIGYTSSFAQDSDLVLGVQADPDDETIRKLYTVIGRSVGRVDMRCTFDWGTMSFDELEYGGGQEEESDTDTTRLGHAWEHDDE